MGKDLLQEFPSQMAPHRCQPPARLRAIKEDRRYGQTTEVLQQMISPKIKLQIAMEPAGLGSKKRKDPLSQRPSGRMTQEQLHPNGDPPGNHVRVPWIPAGGAGSIVEIDPRRDQRPKMLCSLGGGLLAEEVFQEFVIVKLKPPQTRGSLPVQARPIKSPSFNFVPEESQAKLVTGEAKLATGWHQRRKDSRQISDRKTRPVPARPPDESRQRSAEPLCYPGQNLSRTIVTESVDVTEAIWYEQICALRNGDSRRRAVPRCQAYGRNGFAIDGLSAISQI
jgi:hypothetical protein